MWGRRGRICSTVREPGRRRTDINTALLAILVVFAVLLSAAVLLLLGTFWGVSRRQRREAGQLSDGLTRVAESLADARADLATKIDEVGAAQHSGQSDQASGVRDLSDLLEGQIARLARPPLRAACC